MKLSDLITGLQKIYSRQMDDFIALELVTEDTGVLLFSVDSVEQVANHRRIHILIRVEEETNGNQF